MSAGSDNTGKKPVLSDQAEPPIVRNGYRNKGLHRALTQLFSDIGLSPPGGKPNTFRTPLRNAP